MAAELPVATALRRCKAPAGWQEAAKQPSSRGW